MRVDQSTGQDELKTILEENLKYTKQILVNTEKTRRYIFWISLANWFKTFIFIAPIVLAIIFLPPLLKKADQYFKDLQKGLGSAGLPGGVGPSLLSPSQLKMYEDLLKKLPAVK